MKATKSTTTIRTQRQQQPCTTNQFGKLIDIQSVEKFYKKCRYESRQTLLKRLYQHNVHQQQQLTSSKLYQTWRHQQKQKYKQKQKQQQKQQLQKQKTLMKTLSIMQQQSQLLNEQSIKKEKFNTTTTSTSKTTITNNLVNLSRSSWGWGFKKYKKHTKSLSTMTNTFYQNNHNNHDNNNKLLLKHSYQQHQQQQQQQKQQQQQCSKSINLLNNNNTFNDKKNYSSNNNKISYQRKSSTSKKTYTGYKNQLQLDIQKSMTALVEWAHFDKNNSIVKQISRIFQLNLDYLQGKDTQTKKRYIEEKIQQEIIKIIELGVGLGDNSSNQDDFGLGVEVGVEVDEYNNEYNKNNNENPQLITITNNNTKNNNNKTFQWMNYKSKYQFLKPIFQEILMQKIKLFDNQLGQLVKLNSGNNKYLNKELINNLKRRNKKNDYQCYSLQKKQQNNNKNNPNPNPNNNNNNNKRLLKKNNKSNCKFYQCQQKQQQFNKKSQSQQMSQIMLQNNNSSQKQQFCNTNGRDKSQLLLKKWTTKEQTQFLKKKSMKKITYSNNPILFEFVKEHTKTSNARDLIYRKWQNHKEENLSPQDLKYLCATSLFLNQTLGQAQKARLKTNIKTIGKQTISKLQFNIAQHIINSYKTFIKKISQLRASFYQNLTTDRKATYNQTKQKQQRQKTKQKNIIELQKKKRMFTNIIESQKFKMKLNFKVYRWVKLFVKNLKQKIIYKNSNGDGRSIVKEGRNISSTTLTTTFIKNKKQIQNVKKIVNKINQQYNQIHPFIQNMKKNNPSSKIIKRQNHETFRPQTKKYVGSTKFYYEKDLQQTIQKFNKLSRDHRMHVSNTVYLQKLSGGPPSAIPKININLLEQKVSSPKKCLKQIIKIQSIWRKIYYQKQYIIVRDQHRQKMQIDFQSKRNDLHRIYPKGKPINYNLIKNRMKRITMRINNIAQPYVRKCRKAINMYTYFSKYKINPQQLRIKYSRMHGKKLAELAKLFEKNNYYSITQNGYVITQKQINAKICKENASMLWWAVRNGNYELVKKLLEGGGDPNTCNSDNDCSYCLHEAMKRGDIQIIFILLDFGADLNKKNKQDKTPLFYCTKKMLKILGLEEGKVSDVIVASQSPTLLNMQTTIIPTIATIATIDNNKLFYKHSQSYDIYKEHCF